MSTKENKKPKTLYYDLETMLMTACTFRLGKQVIRHDSLVDGFHLTQQDYYDLHEAATSLTQPSALQVLEDVVHRIGRRTSPNQPNIICITYCWDTGPAKALVFDYDTQDCSAICAEFDEILKEADVIIGKNSDKFDRKHLNTQRLLSTGDGMPEWSDTGDDLEKQMRKNFMLPSYSLDYFSKLLGLGGKMKMEYKDWYDILYQTANGEKALAKMVKYGKKDVLDTRTIWQYCSKHFKPKFNAATYHGRHVCVNCGSDKTTKNGGRIVGKTKRQVWYCNEHGGYAGYTVKEGGKLSS